MLLIRLTVYVLCFFIFSSAHMTTLKQSLLDFQSADVGANMTLLCSCQDDKTVMFHWYKQTVGETPALVSTFYKHNNKGNFHNEFKNTSRFSMDTENLQCYLRISDLRISDSATYYCVGTNLFDNVFEFCEGTTISVKGSGLNIPAWIHQSASEIIQPGGSVTLNCTVHTGTCDGEHSVYWFKHSQEAHPGLIYTHGGRNDQCERKDNIQTHTCVYNLPTKSLNLSHTGTYYCAVASCGHILFGNRTNGDLKDEVDSLVSVYFLSAALTFTTVLVVLLALSLYKMNKINCQCTDTESLHYAALRAHKPNRSRRQRNNTDSECVYSSVKP
uniref:Ig-like domain-containing protein n=1 Tax=Sparus aurata TaxID=8175 RepID=A0A671XXY4_SPAAU